MYEGDGAKSTGVLTFRMPDTRIEKLRLEAKKRRVSMNTLVNQIVESHFEFHAAASSAGFMPFPKKLLKVMINSADSSNVSDLARMAAGFVIPEVVYMKRNTFTKEAFLDTLLSWTKFSGFEYRDTIDGEKRTITITHNMGPKWSQFMAELLEIAFSRLEVPVSLEKPNDMLVISIKQ